MCFKWPNHMGSCASPILLPPQFLKVLQLLSELSLNVQSLLIVIVASEKSKPSIVFEYPGGTGEEGDVLCYFSSFLF